MVTSMDISQRFNELTKERIRDLMFSAVFFSTKFPKDKIQIEEYYEETVRSSIDRLLNGGYCIHTPDLELVFEEEKKIDILVDLIVDACHEATHINQKEFYAKSHSKIKEYVFEDSVANSLWQNLKKEHYPDQLYELDARKQSFSLAFKFLKEELNLTEQEQHFFAKKLFFNFYDYEFLISEEKLQKLDKRLDLVSSERILEIIDGYFNEEIVKALKEPYELENVKNLKRTPEADSLLDKSFSSRVEQNLAIIESFANIKKYPYKESLVRDYVKSSEKLCRLLDISPDITPGRF